MNNIEQSIPCPHCEKIIDVEFSKCKKGFSMNCPHCKAKLTFKDDGFAKLNDSLNKLLKDRTIEIKF